MRFLNQMQVLLTDNTWVICNFIKLIDSAGENGRIKSIFLLEGVISEKGGSEERIISGQDILEVYPVHRIPLLLTFFQNGQYYEFLSDGICFRKTLYPCSSCLNIRYLVRYEKDRSDYQALIQAPPDYHSVNITKLIESIRDNSLDSELHIYSIEPFYVNYDSVVRDDPNRLYSVRQEFGHTIDSSSFLITVNHVYKTVSIDVQLDCSYSTRNFDVARLVNASFCKRSSTRKLCLEYINNLLNRLNNNTTVTSIEEELLYNQAIQYKVSLSQIMDIAQLLNVSEQDFERKLVSSSNVWNW